MTPDQVKASIVPKSDQLNADDLLTGPMTVTVKAVKRGNAEQPIDVLLEECKPYRPCKTMRRVLIAAWSDDPKNWIGQTMTLFNDPAVKWAGVAIGGIRISHLSGIDNDREFMLTVTRGQKSAFLVRRLEGSPLNEADHLYIDDSKGEIAIAETMEALKVVGVAIAGKSKAIQDVLRPIYVSRSEALKSSVACERCYQADGHEDGCPNSTVGD